MSYGIQIIEPDGTNWVETFQPFNIIDTFIPSGRGSKTYAVSAGEQICICPSLKTDPPVYNGMWVYANMTTGVVNWPSSDSYLLKANEMVIYVHSGEAIFVMRKR